MAKSTETAVAVKDETAVSTEVDYSAYSGAGFENQDNSDIQVPFLRILQALSPEVKSPAKGGIEGAEVGKLFNTVTQECYDEVLFVPSTTKHIYNEWVPVDDGGGFVGSYSTVDKFVLDAKEEAKRNDLPFGTLKTPEGNDLVETFDLYGVLVTEDNEPMPCIVSFTSSKIKIYKKWMSSIRMFVLNTPNGKIKPDLFAHLVKISTQDEKNKAGQEYSNFKLSPAHGTLKKSLLGSDTELFQAGQDMYRMVEDGVAKADMSTNESAAGSTSETKSKGDVPF